MTVSSAMVRICPIWMPYPRADSSGAAKASKPAAAPFNAAKDVISFPAMSETADRPPPFPPPFPPRSIWPAPCSTSFEKALNWALTPGSPATLWRSDWNAVAIFVAGPEKESFITNSTPMLMVIAMGESSASLPRERHAAGDQTGDSMVRWPAALLIALDSRVLFSSAFFAW